MKGRTNVEIHRICLKAIKTDKINEIRIRYRQQVVVGGSCCCCCHYKIVSVFYNYVTVDDKWLRQY